MNNLLHLLGSLLGLAGVLVSVSAILGRLLDGFVSLAGMELRTWLLGGLTLMVMGCLAKLHALTEARRDR